jgi:hypothetical protein
MMLDIIEDFLMGNKETFYALAGDFAPELKKKKAIDVTSVIVNETWTKANGAINSEAGQHNAVC